MIVCSRRRGSRRGGVLIATLVLVMTIAAVAACLFQIDSMRARRQLASVDNKRAFNIAEAGLAEGFYGLTIGKTGAVGTQESPAGFGGGLFWVEATDMGDDVVGLESTGMYGSGRVSLSLVAKRSPESIASLGVFGGDEVVVGALASIEAYDSSGADVPVGTLRVQSNGDITVGANSIIDGDAAPGPTGTVLLALGAQVTGSTAPNECAIELPEIDVPDHPLFGNVTQLLGQRVLPSGEQAYGSISVNPAAKVVIQGPASVVVGTLSVSGLGTLSFDTSAGPVTLYVTNWLNLKNGSRLTFSSTNPADVSVLVTATGTFDRDGNGTPDPAACFLCRPPFYGTLYVPLAALNLPANFQLYGTISAQSLTFGTAARVHYDNALDVQTTADPGGVERLSWRVIDIPVEIAQTLSPDPFDVLGVSQAALPSPADAHADAAYVINVQYKDLAGNLQTYSGPESGFDWSLVKSVTKIVRTIL